MVACCWNSNSDNSDHKFDGIFFYFSRQQLTIKHRGEAELRTTCDIKTKNCVNVKTWLCLTTTIYFMFITDKFLTNNYSPNNL